MATPINRFVMDDFLLRDALETLTDRFNLTIVCDRAALDNAGVEEDRIDHFSVRNVTVGDALTSLLRPVGLACAVRGSYIAISTPEGLENFARSNTFGPGRRQ